MKVYSTSVPGAVGWGDGLFCWDEQLRNIIAVANERMMFLKRDSGGMGGSFLLEQLIYELKIYLHLLFHKLFA